MSAPAKEQRPRARLRRLRRAQGWNSRAAALAAQVLPSVYSGIETGRLPVLNAERAWFPAAERIAASHRMLVEDVFPREARGLVERFVPCRPGVMERVLRTRDWGRVADDRPEERLERAVYLREVRAHVDRIVAAVMDERGDHLFVREPKEVSALAAVGWETGDAEGPTEMGKRFGKKDFYGSLSRARSHQIVLEGNRLLRERLMRETPMLDVAEEELQELKREAHARRDAAVARREAEVAWRVQQAAEDAVRREREIVRQQAAKAQRAARQPLMRAAWEAGLAQAQEILDRCTQGGWISTRELFGWFSEEGQGGPRYCYAVELQIQGQRGGLIAREAWGRHGERTLRIYGLSPGQPLTEGARAVLDRMFFERAGVVDACSVWAIREDALSVREGPRWDTAYPGNDEGWPVVRVMIGGGPRAVEAKGKMWIRGCYSDVYLEVQRLAGDFGLPT